MEPTNTRATLGQARSGCVTPAAKNSSNLLTCDVIKIRPLWSVPIAAHCHSFESPCKRKKGRLHGNIFQYFVPSPLPFQGLSVSFSSLSFLLSVTFLFSLVFCLSSFFFPFILVLLLLYFFHFLICFLPLVSISFTSHFFLSSSQTSLGLFPPFLLFPFPPFTFFPLFHLFLSFLSSFGAGVAQTV